MTAVAPSLSFPLATQNIYQNIIFPQHRRSVSHPPPLPDSARTITSEESYSLDLPLILKDISPRTVSSKQENLFNLNRNFSSEPNILATYHRILLPSSENLTGFRNDKKIKISLPNMEKCANDQKIKISLPNMEKFCVQIGECKSTENQHEKEQRRREKSLPSPPMMIRNTFRKKRFTAGDEEEITQKLKHRHESGKSLKKNRTTKF